MARERSSSSPARSAEQRASGTWVWVWLPISWPASIQRPSCSQDAAGRERILDLISAIQDDFDKIIVITHLDELKDVFPVRIEVQKGEYGSTFWLS